MRTYDISRICKQHNHFTDVYSSTKVLTPESFLLLLLPISYHFPLHIYLATQLIAVMYLKSPLLSQASRWFTASVPPCHRLYSGHDFRGVGAGAVHLTHNTLKKPIPGKGNKNQKTLRNKKQFTITQNSLGPMPSNIRGKNYTSK